jgi:hypothetical protein
MATTTKTHREMEQELSRLVQRERQNNADRTRREERAATKIMNTPPAKAVLPGRPGKVRPR